MESLLAEGVVLAVDRVIHFLHARRCCRHLQEIVQIEDRFELVFVGAMVHHNLESFVVSLAVSQHVATAMYAAERVALEVDQESEHESRVVQETLKSFQRKLIELVVNGHNLQFVSSLVLAHRLDHLLRVDECSDIEHHFVERDVQLFSVDSELLLDIVLQELAVGVVHRLLLLDVVCFFIKIFRIEFAEVPNQIFVDDFVSNLCCAELGQFKFDCIHI